jgi:hypothetical protein
MLALSPSSSKLQGAYSLESLRYGYCATRENKAILKEVQFREYFANLRNVKVKKVKFSPLQALKALRVERG